MSFEINKATLIEYLNNENLEPTLQEETDLVYTTFKVNAYELTLFFVILEKSQLVQLICYFPFQLSEKTISETARLLHFLNKEVDMPGFGMDEKEQILFYRAVIPSLDGKIEKRLIRLHLGTLKLACETFLPLIQASLQGAVRVSDLIKGRKHQ